jgi:hypothetical protein
MKTKPEIYADRLAELTPEERAKLRSMLNDPTWMKLLRMVAVFKPSSNVTNGGSGGRDAFSDARANARLGEIRGWELHELAIFLALNEPKEVKQAVQESFPDEGRVDADWNRVPPAPSTAIEPKKPRKKKK